MLHALLFLAAAAILPAPPRILVAGDVDGDGRAELVALLVYAEHGSIAEVSATGPGRIDVDVTPAIEERRELWVLRIDGKRLVPLVAPQEVDPGLLAIGAAAADQPVYAILDEGAARLELVRGPAGNPERIVFRQIAPVEPLMARSRILVVDYPFQHELDGTPPAELVVPTAQGLAIVGDQGLIRMLGMPLTEIQSGAEGRMRVTLPRIVDADGDGTLDLLDIAGLSGGWSEKKIALRRGLGGGAFSEPTIWTVTPLLEETVEERREGLVRSAWDALDLDDDGALEFALSVSRIEADSLREGLELVRGVTRRIELYHLAADGTVARTPERTFEIEGHPWWLRHPGGWHSPFRDLDGDGYPELLALRIGFGYFGALRALTFGTIKASLRPVVLRAGRDGIFRPIEDSVPKARFRMDLDQLDLSRFRTFPGDLDGDGRLDMVDVDRDEVSIFFGRPGPRFPDTPDRVLPLGAAVADLDQILFLDVDGRGALDLVAIEPRKPRRGDDRPSRPVRLELIPLDKVRP